MQAKYTFTAHLQIIGINPYVAVPVLILKQLFMEAGRDKSPISIVGTVNGKPYKQSLVRYSGDWRLYINTTMLERSPERIGEVIEVTISFDPVKRTIETHPILLQALSDNVEARDAFHKLTPYLRHEMVRYISQLKTEESIRKNVDKAIEFLLGRGRFVGRDPK